MYISNKIKKYKEYLEINIIKLLLAIIVSTLAIANDTNLVKGNLVITADQLLVQQKTQDSHFWGQVVVSQDDLTINADDLYAHQDQQGYKYITLKGKPAHFKQIDKDGKSILGVADYIIYNTKSKILQLKYKAKIEKNSDLVTGEAIQYNTVTHHYEVFSLNHNSRVMVVLQDHSQP